MERLEAGYVKWFNPFNGVPLYVGFKKMRCVVFWSKNPRPMLVHLNALDAICPNYYFQFTLNDYDAERIEPRVPPLDERVETFKRLSERVGKDRVVWRFDPLILTDKLSVSDILAKVEPSLTFSRRSNGWVTRWRNTPRGLYSASLTSTPTKK